MPADPRPPRARLLPALAGTAAGLAAAALINAARTRAAEAAHPPQGDFVEAGGIRLHYLDRGPRDAATPPIVLIHGNGSLTDDFVIAGVVDALASRHRVVVFDRPGAGYSERPRGRRWGPVEQAEVLVEAAAALGLQRPVVVGHSWGTLPAIVWALDHPERVSALVLASGYYFPTPRPDVVTVLPAIVPGIGDLMRHTLSPILGRAMIPLGNRLIFSPAPTPDKWSDEFPFELAMRPSMLRATLADTAQMVPAAAALEPRYKDLSLPMVLLAGDGDKLVNTAHQTKRLAGLHPEARLIVLPGVGHMVQHTRPDAFVAAVETAVAMAG
ncbi:MAG: alpha/beta hydrolase [Sphingomonadaceae bacterium]|nr:alpha/beta hydrolase [Sphingomonadaceae bacterium]